MARPSATLSAIIDEEYTDQNGEIKTRTAFVELCALFPATTSNNLNGRIYSIPMSALGKSSSLRVLVQFGGQS